MDIARVGPEFAALPTDPGTYALIFHCTRPVALRAGALGWIRLPAGYYVYTGSALGPGGLRARLARHIAGPARLHWHVDYLRARSRCVEIWLAAGAERQEHLWAAALAEVADGLVPKFGASDCRCPSHLFHFERRPWIRLLAARLPWESTVSYSRISIRQK